MKLRKAIEKAKKERGEIRPLVQEQDANGLDTTIKLPVQSKPVTAEWIAPEYNKSKSVKVDSAKAADNKCVAIFPDAAEIDYYKVLRTQIQQRAQANGWKTVMITSANPGEGKTTTSINLAATMAKEFNQTVLLVDNDLRHQSIHNYLGISSNLGLIDYLENNKHLSDLIIWPGIEKLTIISGGREVVDSTELVSSPRMKELVAEMKSRYDDRYIVFDVPPLLGCADAAAFAPMVDCILMVVEDGRTEIEDVKKAVELIPKEKFLGYVLNRRKTATSKYKNYYSG
jgi:non-specific protein-tyrosine kinase